MSGAGTPGRALIFRFLSFEHLHRSDKDNAQSPCFAGTARSARDLGLNAAKSTQMHRFPTQIAQTWLLGSFHRSQGTLKARSNGFFKRELTQ